MFTASKLKSTLLSSIDYVVRHRSEFVCNPDRDMTRIRKCGFNNTIMATLSLASHSLNQSLFHVFGPGEKLPSKSAFVQQRAKINDHCFPFLFHEFNAAVPFRNTFNGLHLIACDGSDINLVPDRSDHENFMSYASGRGGYYQIHLNACFDLLEQRFVDVFLQPRPQFNEKKALSSMVDRFPIREKCLFIADRGYLSFNLMAHVIENHHFFLIRVPHPSSERSFLKHFTLPDSGEYSRSLEFSLTRSYKKVYRKNPEKYKCLHPKRCFDFIAPDDRLSLYTLRFRVVRLLLPSASPEYLITNLPEEGFSLKILKHLYRMRWNLETSFRRLKYTLALNYFHSVKRSFIVQEIYARLIMFNFTALLTAFAEKSRSHKPSNKWRYRPSFEDAAYIAREFLIQKFSNETIKALLLKHPSALRPDRQYPRSVRSQTARSLNNRA